MSQIAASHGHGHDSHGHPAPNSQLLAESNVNAPGFASGLAYGLLGLGALCIALTFAYMFALGGENGFKHGLASYHVGALAGLGFALGPLGILLIMHLVQAGWIVTMRRQIENAAGNMWIALLLLIPSAIFASKLFKWTDEGLLATDALLVKKSPFLNEPFFYARLGIYAVIWIALAWRFRSLSLKQDQTGDKRLSATAKTLAAPGMIAFALTTAFAGFDLVMSLDFHWFSTMLGVWFFAGNMIASLGMFAVIFSMIRASGRLKGLVTDEHFHDLGKLMLGFTVFWAYISFSQYFLIWYANIPEETAFYIIRGAGGSPNSWTPFFYLLIGGHFIAPFLLLLFRDVKKSTLLLPAIGLWLMAMHCVDVFWMVRPIVYKLQPEIGAGLSWVDITGVLGPVCIVLGMHVRSIGRSPLIPLRDPRLHEAMKHKNYV